MTTYDLNGAAHVVQLALTPVFLLSGIAALLNVFASRLGRVADQTDALASKASSAQSDLLLGRLRMRSVALDWAVVLAALGGALTCASVLVLFLGGVRGESGADLLFVCFGGATLLTMGSLVAFVAEMMLAAGSVRRVVDASVSEARTADGAS